jgi:dolichyl-phosphate beta-glucosyltransferase
MVHKPIPPVPDLSIIIPAYQEAALIQSSLGSLAKWLETHDYGTVEVIVPVAESPDGTLALAGECAGLFTTLKVLDIGPRVGKGHNVRNGMLAATGRYRLFMDADLATPLKHLDDVQRLIKQDAAIIMAVRPLSTIHKGRLRSTVTRAGNVLSRIVLLPGISDTQCGFKAFRADAADEIFSRLTIGGWGFDLEALALARKLGYRIRSFQAPDWHDPKPPHHGLTGNSVVGVSLQVLVNLFSIRWRLLRGEYALSERHSLRKSAAE